MAVGVVELLDFGPEAAAVFGVGLGDVLEVGVGGVGLAAGGFEFVDALVDQAADFGEVGGRGGEWEEVGGFREGAVEGGDGVVVGWGDR